MPVGSWPVLERLLGQTPVKLGEVGSLRAGTLQPDARAAERARRSMA